MTGLDLLVIAAHDSELSGLQRALGPELEGTLGSLRVAARAVGVGALAAGAGTARHLGAQPTRATLLIGSCGVFTERWTALEMLAAERVDLVDSAQLRGQAAYPDPLPRYVLPHAALVRGLARVAPQLRRARVANTMGITTDDALAAELARLSGCEAENLEALAAGLACQQHGVPFAALLAVTNRVGARGRAEWRRHRAEAARLTAELALMWIAEGAPGLGDPP